MHQVELEMQNEELRRAQQELEASRNKYVVLYNDLYDFAPVGYFTLDEKGTILKANLTGAAILEVERSRLLNKPFTDYVTENSQDIFYLHRQQIFSGRERQRCEIALVKKDGAQWYAQLESMPVFDNEGTVRNCQTVVYDITEIKHAEEALQKSEERFRSVTQHANDSIFIADCSGVIVFWNRKSEELYGYTAAEVLGKRYSMLLQERVRDIHEKWLQRFFTGEKANNLALNEGKFTCKDGTELEVEISVAFFKQGKEELCVVISRDITERKRAMERLLEINEYLDNLINYANAPIVVWDTQNRITRFNHAFEALTGRKAHDVIGKSLEILFPSVHIESSMKLLKNTQAGELSETVEIDILNIDGSIRTLLLNAATVFVSDRMTPVDTIAQGTDITERKRAENVLVRNEENFRRSLDDSPLGVRIVNTENETVYTNRAMLNIYGYDSIEELKTTPEEKHYTPESYAEFKMREEKRRRGEDYPTEYTMSIVRKNGEVRHLQVFRKEILWNDERLFNTLYMDITTRKFAENALRESEARYRVLFESINDAIFVYCLEEAGTTGGFSQVNDVACQRLGYTRDELLAMNPRDITTPEAYEIVSAARGELLSNGEIIIETVHVTKDGRQIPVESSVRLFKYFGKQTAISIARDITKRKQTEAALINSLIQVRALAAHLEKVREEERTHIGRMVHDELGQALTGLKLDIFSIEKKLSAKDAKLPVPLILKKLQSMNALINETASLVNRIVLQLRPVMLDDLGLQAAIEWQVEDIQERSELRCSFSSNLKHRKLDREMASVMFRILQEAMNNVVRHAHATAVKILLRHKENTLLCK